MGEKIKVYDFGEEIGFKNSDDYFFYFQTGNSFLSYNDENHKIKFDDEQNQYVEWDNDDFEIPFDDDEIWKYSKL